MEKMIIGLILVGVAFVAFRSLRVVVLHILFEVGASPEKRYHAASKMLAIAIRRPTSGWRHRELHLALDVVLCEGKFDDLAPDSSLHRKYWELGHAITVQLMNFYDHQRYLNIGDVWFAENYDAALEIIRKK